VTGTVKRYAPEILKTVPRSVVMGPSNDGGWVSYSDYAALEQHIETLERAATSFEEWWNKEGRFYDPDTEDVPWFDKRKELAELAFISGVAQSRTALQITLGAFEAAMKDKNTVFNPSEVVAIARAALAETERGVQ
jgi:hypothetical protein